MLKSVLGVFWYPPPFLVKKPKKNVPPFSEILDPPLYPQNIIKYLFFVLRYLHYTCYQSYF